MIQSYFDGIIQRLSLSFAIAAFQIKKMNVKEEQGFIRIKCVLTNGELFEFSEYIEIVGTTLRVETYSYHWQTLSGKLVKRWDNVEHHYELPSFPHHIHQADGAISESAPMTLQLVLTEIEARLAQAQN